MSCASIGRKKLPCLAKILALANSNIFLSGAGPDALPPFVFKIAPAGLTNEKSN
jgi:hypothetical protein